MSDLENENRLRMLEATGLLDSAPEEAFDRLTRLATSLLRTPVALVSLVDARRQFFKSALGLKEPWASRRGTPLTHSFCQYATRSGTALVVGDAREDAELRENLAIRDLNVVAYAGIPLVVGGEAIGAFCVIDDKPHSWTGEEVRLLADLAASVVSEIELRLALREARDQRAMNEALIEGLGDGVMAIDANRKFVLVNAAARRAFSAGPEAGKSLPPDWAALHHSQRPDGTPLPSEDGALARALRGENTDGLEFTLETPDTGESRWIEASGRPVRDETGRVTAGIAVYRDVTERKRRTDLYAALAGNIPDGLALLFDRELRCLAIDGGLLRRDGIRPDTMIGRTLSELADAAGSGTQFDRLEPLFRGALRGITATADFDHRDRALALHVAPVHDGLGRISGGIVLALDVTIERRARAALGQREQAYRAIVERLPNGGAFMTDRDLRYVTADGPIAADMLRRSKLPTLIGRTVAELASFYADSEEVLDVYRSALGGETRNFEFTRNGRFFDVTSTPIHDGERVTHALVFLYDVTARKAELAELRSARIILEQQARELQEASVTDELTGLLNRRGFMLLADQQIKIAERNNQKLMMVFVDLNGMKFINDTFGHKMGDRALVDTASLLRKLFRGSDVIARLGGDEFVVLAVDAAAVGGPTIAVRMRRALVDHNAAASPFRLSLSIGTSVFDPARPSTLDKLLSEADARMYEEKVLRRPAEQNRIKLS